MAADEINAALEQVLEKGRSIDEALRECVACGALLHGRLPLTQVRARPEQAWAYRASKSVRRTYGSTEVAMMTDGTSGRDIRRAAFRSCLTGAVIEAGACHDIACLPGGPEADLDEWQAGFTDASGRFLDRAQAAAAAGCDGRLEARAYFGGEPDPTLEAGRRESWCAPRAA